MTNFWDSLKALNQKDYNATTTNNNSQQVDNENETLFNETGSESTNKGKVDVFGFLEGLNNSDLGISTNNGTVDNKFDNTIMGLINRGKESLKAFQLQGIMNNAEVGNVADIAQGLGQVDIDGETYGVWIREGEEDATRWQDANKNYFENSELEGKTPEELLAMVNSGEAEMHLHKLDADGKWQNDENGGPGWNDTIVCTTTDEILETFGNNKITQPTPITETEETQETQETQETENDSQYNYDNMTETNFVDKFNEDREAIDEKYGLRFLEENTPDAIKAFSQDPNRARAYVESNFSSGTWYGLDETETAAAYVELTTWLDSVDKYYEG